MPVKAPASTPTAWESFQFSVVKVNWTWGTKVDSAAGLRAADTYREAVAVDLVWPIWLSEFHV